jgi:hypothetical protein
VVHVGPALGCGPVGVVLQQFDIELVEPARRPDVERALTDLFDGGDAGQGQKQAEVIGEIGILAGDSLAGGQFLCLKVCAIGRKDELGLGGLVLGLARKAWRVASTAPRSQVAIWMLLR